MQYAKQVHPINMDNANKEKSIYMRFHVTLEKAMELITKCYKGLRIPNTDVKVLDHAIRIAGLTEQIQCQDYLDYHLTWLTGVLKDLKTIYPKEYLAYIDELLEELRVEEAERIKKYIDQLTNNTEISQGKRCKEMADRVGQMDAIPCYIEIFELFSFCSLWKAHRWEKSIMEYEGFMCFAYMFYYKAISKHMLIGKNLKQEIKMFFKKISDQFGGMSAIRNKAEVFYKS